MNRKQRRAQKTRSDVKPDKSSIVAQGLFEGAVQHHQAGRLREAEQLCRQALAVEPRHDDSLHLLGVMTCQSGRFETGVDWLRKAIAANRKIPGYPFNLGIALMSLGRADEAAQAFRSALDLRTAYPEAHYNLGNALRVGGKLHEAVASYRNALELRPGYTEAECNLGVALTGLGQLDEAVLAFRRALAITAAFPEVSLNLGNVLKDQGELDEAIACYRQALDLKPDYAEAHCSLGTALAYLGRHDQAEDSFRRALAINPTSVVALNNLAWTLNAEGRSNLALDTIRQSLRIGETPEARAIFVDCVMHLADLPGDEDFQATMARALTEPWARPRELAPIAINLVKRSATPIGNPLLRALLEAAPVCDIELERFLTRARRLILDDLVGRSPADVMAGVDLGLPSALARQCFVNEYVFSTTDDEIRNVAGLTDAMAEALDAGTAVPALWPLVIAMYAPLGSIPLASRLLERRWPVDVAAVLAQQVLEPAEERAIRASIPALTEIEDEVSLLVQSQYEANPYPRWEKVPPGVVQGSVGGALRKKFPLASFEAPPARDHIDILIAGCGTGQQSIDVTRTYPGARVLAVDLSRTSLGYAIRKSRELGLSSIEYAQADLLRLGSLDRRFDFISCSGVLHHLADPWTGWRVLLSLLRHGGFMKLGFYSEAARRHVVRAQKFVSQRGYGVTADEIRRCRRDMLDTEQGEGFGPVFRLHDFFSTSMCRDLLFHAQEHRMALTEIDDFLRTNDLTFLGFDVEPSILRSYRSRFPDDPSATNLGHWHHFEQDNPDTFLGMYQFWVQK